MSPKPFIFLVVSPAGPGTERDSLAKDMCFNCVRARFTYRLGPSETALKKIPIVAGQFVTYAEHFEPRGCMVSNAQKSGGPTAKTLDVSVRAPDVAGILCGRPQDQDNLASSWENTFSKGFACKRAIWWAGRQSSMRTPERPKGYIDNPEWVKNQ